MRISFGYFSFGVPEVDPTLQIIALGLELHRNTCK